MPDTTTRTPAARPKKSKGRASKNPDKGAHSLAAGPGWQTFTAKPARKHRRASGAPAETQRPPGVPHRFSYASLHRASPIVRADLVKEGAPAALLTDLASALQMSKERVYQTLGLARATADRKVRADARLDPDATERALGLARLVGQVEAIVGESGDPDAAASFDAAAWVADFLERPHAALGGRRPGDLMDTVGGRTAVGDLVAQMQSGAYA